MSVRLGRRLVLIAGTILGMTGLLGGTAQAVTYQPDRGPYDMRGYVSNTNAMYSCGTGWVGQSRVDVRAPSNYGVHVYLTTYMYHWENGTWVQRGGGASVPGGTDISAGAAKYFPAYSWSTSAGYWYLYVEADIHRLSSAGGAEVGSVNIKPTSAADFRAYAGASTYNGTGWSPHNSATAAYATWGYGFCYHA